MGRRPPSVARVLERVTATIRDHEMVAPGQAVVASVSGGPDSLCMVYALHELRRLLKVTIEVFHFDHRLREGSGADADYVRRVAERLKVPFHLRVAGSEPARGESVEDWAHRARFGALALVLRDVGADRAAIAHTRDDQAETVLLAAIRGGGLDAMAGIRPMHGPYIRPLIDVTRVEVETFCRSLRLRPRADPTNRDTRLLRNAIRLKAIPDIERATRREVRDSLARTAGLLRDDADELQRLALAAEGDLVEERAEGFALATTRLLALPRAVSSRVVRAILYRAGYLPSAEMVDALLDLAAGRPGRRRDLPGPSTATRERGYVLLPRTSPEVAD
ncbi:MAG: tRNA lysidine(34) synthetase TilS [Actinomycetota bacterium]